MNIYSFFLGEIMKGDNTFLIAIVLGVLIILGTGVVRAATAPNTEFCIQHENNLLCAEEGLTWEKPFAVESAHITWEKICEENS